jgi:hypothetical protein
LLSLVGLTSSATPAASKVLQEPSQTPDTKTESKIKLTKSQQESAATKNDSTIKLTKTAGEQQAGQDVVSEKVGADHVVHKHIAGVKYEKQNTGSNAGKTEMKVDPAKLSKATAENTAARDAAQNKKFAKSSAETHAGKTEQTVKLTNADAASKDAAKLSKASTENTAIQDSQIKKVKTVTGESNAVKSDIGKKERKAGKDQQDALTVKQKTSSGKTNDSSKGVLIGLSEAQKNDTQKKALKNAAESNAAQKSADIKLQKQTDKASPK